MSYLTSALKAAVKAVRARGWTEPFTIEHVSGTPADDYYDEPDDLVEATYLFSGSFAWRGLETKQGTQGGMAIQGQLLLACDEDLLTYFLFSGARLIVHASDTLPADLMNVPLAITSYTPYPDFGEIVVYASRRADP